MTQRDLFRPNPPPWNRGCIIRPKPPFKAKHVWAIRQQLKVAGRVHDLALFDCGIGAKLRGCDLVKLKVSDVAPGGALRTRATVIQQKTGRPVPFEITDTTRNALAAWLRGTWQDDWLFPGRTRMGEHMSTRHYARLVREWVALIDLEPKAHGTHSLRRTKVAVLYKKTGNLRAGKSLFGHRKLESTVRYLGIEVDDALAMSEQVDLWSLRPQSPRLRAFLAREIRLELDTAGGFRPRYSDPMVLKPVCTPIIVTAGTPVRPRA